MQNAALAVSQTGWPMPDAPASGDAELTIEYNIPLPPKAAGGRGGGPVARAAAAMTVGASVNVPNASAACNVATALRNRHGSKGGPQIAATRKQPDGSYRVWRIA